MYRFSKVKWRTEGADFEGFYQGKRVKIEIEKSTKEYLQHGHGAGFADIVVVLLPRGPKIEGVKVVKLDLEHFIKWWWPRAGWYKHWKEAWERLDWVAKAFASEFRANCPDKEREMATCPECDLCPYFAGHIEDDELRRFLRIQYDQVGAASEYFRALAARHLKKMGLLEKVLSGEVSPDQIFTRVCPTCKREFHPFFPDQLYCSKHCLEQAEEGCEQ
jgi:hypothetical protein